MLLAIMFAMLFDKAQIMKSHSDQTGRFPILSSRGNHCIFVLYHHDTNSVHAVAIPNCQAASIRKAWERTHKSLIAHSHAPNLHILDNECSQELKDSFVKHNISFQRVPRKEHRANAAERTIRTFKNHFISTLCTVDAHFPLSEWDRLLPQAILTLNLLRSSRKHPSLSAHASLFGHYDLIECHLLLLALKLLVMWLQKVEQHLVNMARLAGTSAHPRAFSMPQVLFPRHHDRT
jgi:hypothetical protein